MLNRRELLKGVMLAGGYCMLPLGRYGWALAAPEAASRHLIVVMMRGAVDGLSIVTPYSERYYYQARPDIALAAPGQTNGLLYLDGNFGMHPALASLQPLWQNRTLAFVHASGSPAETRSHFEAQDIMETAMLNSAVASQGWVNGVAQLLPPSASPTRVMCFGNKMPKACQGHFDIPVIPTGIKGNGGKAIENPQLAASLGQLYGGDKELGSLYQEGTSARESVMNDLNNEMTKSANGAPQADAFVGECEKVGNMIQRDPGIQLAFLDVGGWDTHVQQGNAKGQLSNKLEKLGQGLAALAESLGPQYQNTTILVMSEFGRTVAQNGNGGTDHGHGNVAWVMGGDVRGGKVYGRWPGLNPDQLWERRDL
ncbi:MAG TPA: DUF1501 domain-containing protein, partial [Alphaproteobacteria bacterium]|nr:DUF1501 domain-containing protein [Alphaproteobacteria bacterium]